jgi:membrane associated rhomboid family serine protease
MIGFSIEKAIGKWYKYVILIVFGGIGGNLFSSVISPYSVGIGASSSLFALMGF